MWHVEPLHAPGHSQPPLLLQRVVLETRVPARGNVLVLASAAVEYADAPLPATPAPTGSNRARM
jgi:hypothetical protein